MSENYKVLIIDEKHEQLYKTRYFDTPDFKMFTQHHSGKLNRCKIRYRSYLNSDLSFIEVKHKDNKKQTRKWRRKIDVSTSEGDKLPNREFNFIAKHTNTEFDKLSMKLQVEYKRVIFQHKYNNERVTIDSELIFSHGDNGSKTFLDDLIIAEVQRPKPNIQSDFFNIVRKYKVKKIKFSKYCYGISKLNKTLKQNRFKRRFLSLEKAKKYKGSN